MKRLVVPGLDLEPETVTLPESSAKHLTKVMRLGPKDEVLLVDGRGRRGYGVIAYVGEATTVKIHRRENAPPPKRPPLHLIQGLTKGGKMDEIVRRATELGVASIRPALCHRSVARPKPDRAAQRVKRWRKIASEASRQCRRDLLPEVTEVVPLQEILENLNDEILGIALWEDELEVSLASQLENTDATQGVALFIGPEGGLTLQEVTAACNRGFVTASMGPRILRTETAAIAACSLAQHFLGALEPAPHSCS